MRRRLLGEEARDVILQDRRDGLVRRHRVRRLRKAESWVGGHGGHGVGIERVEVGRSPPVHATIADQAVAPLDRHRDDVVTAGRVGHPGPAGVVALVPGSHESHRRW